MTSIKDLELRIKSAASTLEMLRGDLHALKEQQEKDKEPESLFGRWATHPEYGRVIVTCDEPDGDGDVMILFRNEVLPAGGDWGFASFEDLDLDPETLTTAKDFDEAPEDTIAEAYGYAPDVYKKVMNAWYAAGYDGKIPSHEMSACRVIRWGSGK
ncbi:hypothetical protein [Corynebacterium amycolatum]|uniref:hypothetical protein n=1 Tax=Corynebacterium amycolatum TaxID=43765 RepID=UPI001CCBA052|nr:hypothetical protein [Corynebacterium amycolatum]MCA0444391.1 hypothetical protein [Corynebacterium amycolatum]